MLASLLAATPLTAAAACWSAASAPASTHGTPGGGAEVGRAVRVPRLGVVPINLSGDACADVVIEVPYTAGEQHPAAAPIATWSKSVSASISSAPVDDLPWNDLQALRWSSTGHLAPGAQASRPAGRSSSPCTTGAGGTVWSASVGVGSSNAALSGGRSRCGPMPRSVLRHQVAHRSRAKRRAMLTGVRIGSASP